MFEVKRITASITFETPIFPSRITSKFKTIHEWLTSICQENMPAKIISEFNFHIIFKKTLNEHIVCLYGVNTRLDKNHQPYVYIDFEPFNMFFKFPKTQYKSFTYEQMQDELIGQLKDFIKTELFKHSFLSKANISTNGKSLWIKK